MPGPHEDRQSTPWLPLLAVAGAVALLRLVIIALPGLTLAEDEAMYWDWSRYLALGYFTKPGGIAWLIAASVGVLGQSEFAVRLPAVAAGFIGAVASGILAFDMFRARRAAVASAVAYACVPAFAVLGVLMTIDGPLLAAWALAAWAGHRAAVLGRPSGWLWFGAAVAIGVQFKPTMLLILPGAALFFVWMRIARPAVDPAEAARIPPNRRLAALWMVSGLALVLLGFLPTLLFNVENDWVQAKHLLHHLGVADPAQTPADWEREPWSYLWTLEYPFIQIAMGGAVAVLGVIATVKVLRRGVVAGSPGDDLPTARVRGSVVWCASLALPVLALYLVVTFFTRVEANWPIAAWVTACPLAAWAALAAAPLRDHGLRIGAWLGIGIGVIIYAALLAAPTLRGRSIGGVTIPMHRLTGFESVAGVVASEASRLAERTGRPPFVMAVSYGRTAQLGFYLPGAPTVYASARYTAGGEGRQYDIWAHTDLSRDEVQETLAGRPAVLVGADAGHWQRAFARVEHITDLEHEPGKTIPVFAGYRYRGFEAVGR